MAVRTSVAGASDTPESPNPGQIGPVPGDPERKWCKKRPVEAARQASPYLYPSENPPLHCPGPARYARSAGTVDDPQTEPAVRTAPPGLPAPPDPAPLPLPHQHAIVPALVASRPLVLILIVATFSS